MQCAPSHASFPTHTLTHTHILVSHDETCSVTCLESAVSHGSAEATEVVLESDRNWLVSLFIHLQTYCGE